MHKQLRINALNRSIDLKRIQHFVLLGEELHFSRAAERANLSQTAFSRSIQTLEEDLQLRLFDRDTRTVEVTAAGRQLLDYARELLNSANNLRAEADDMAKAEGGELRFGASNMTSHRLLPLVLNELRSISPKLKLDIEIGYGESLGAKLLEERIEFLVANADSMVDDPRFKVTPLRPEPVSFFCRSSHPLAVQQEVVSREQLFAYPWASVRFDGTTVSRLSRLFGVLPSQLPTALSCNDPGLLRQMLLNSDALLGTWAAWLDDDVQQGTVIDLVPRIQPALSKQPVVLGCAIVQLAGRTLSPSARRAVQLFRQYDQITSTDV